MACADDYVLFGDECIVCDGRSPLWVGILGLLGVAAVLFVVAFGVLKRTTKSAADQTEETRVTRLSAL